MSCKWHLKYENIKEWLWNNYEHESQHVIVTKQQKYVLAMLTTVCI